MRYRSDSGNMTYSEVTSFVGAMNMLASEFCAQTGTSPSNYSRWIKKPENAGRKISDALQVKVDNVIASLLSDDPGRIATLLEVADYVSAVCLMIIGSVPQKAAGRIGDSRVAEALLSPEIPADGLEGIKAALDRIADRKIEACEKDGQMRALLPQLLKLYAAFRDSGISLQDYLSVKDGGNDAARRGRRRSISAHQVERGDELCSSLGVGLDQVRSFLKSESYRALEKQGRMKDGRIKALLDLNNVTLDDLIRLKRGEEEGGEG